MSRERTDRARLVFRCALFTTVALLAAATTPAEARTRTWRGSAASTASAPARAANSFVAREAKTLGIAASEQAYAVATRTTPSGTYVRLERYRDGLRVEGGDVVVRQTRDGRIDLARTRDIPAPPPATTSRRHAAPVDPATAEQLARAAISATPGSNMRTHKLELIHLATRNDVRLAWDLFLFADDPVARWRVTVDAHSGKVLRADDMIRQVTGSGQIFDPNAVVALQDNALLDANDAAVAVPPAAYSTVALQGLDSASGGVFRLTGAYVRAIDLESPIIAPPTHTSPDFVYTRDDPRFEWVVVYAHLDGVQRYLQSLGFTDVANRRVDVDAHALGGDDNAHYVPNGSGAGYVAFGDGGVDDAEDGEVIVHEYGHAIQDDQCPNCFFGQESGALGEGFADFLAAAYFLPVSGGFQDACVGDWDAVSYSDDSPPCLRRVDGTKRYPDDLQFEVHDDGEIWSALLWDVLLEISGGSTPTLAARDVVVALAVESHFLVPSDPTFIEGGEALLDADQALFGGAHQALLDDALGARGLLPGPPAILGGGAQASDCAGVFRYDNPTNRYGAFSPRQECRDNDPSCDSDAIVGQCTFRVTVCLGHVGHPACLPQPTRLFEVLAPRPDHRQAPLAAIGEALTDAIASLPGSVRGGTHDNVVGWAPPVAVGTCAPAADLVVPLKVTPTLTRKATVPVRTRTTTRANVRDPDTLRLSCLP